ncbi:hypothetical protein [Dipodfec virus UOA04_Rod_691]|nr:hypothetical protein [Dipodfec virus UOA04_Rod_691]
MIKVHKSYLSSDKGPTVLFSTSFCYITDLIKLPYDCNCISHRCYSYFLVCFQLLHNFCKKFNISFNDPNSNIKIHPIIETDNVLRPKMCICLEFINGTVNPLVLEYFYDLKHYHIVKEFVVDGHFVYVNPHVYAMKYKLIN